MTVSERNPNKKVTNSLVAMSSAAVLAVYAAGYTRTDAAAKQLDAQSDERRPAGEGRGAGRGPAPAHEVARMEPVSAALPSATTLPDRVATPLPTSAPAIAEAPKTTSPAQTAETAVATPAPLAAPPVTETKPEPVVAVAPPPPPPPPPQPAAAPAPPPAPRWKDGTYTGWGTSRHGDIQAQVIIEDGRIKAASIAQCYTRYSCDVIDKIIPQVAQRQSPETDYVSGATQSTNAFYYGVVDALSKAK